MGSSGGAPRVTSARVDALESAVGLSGARGGIASSGYTVGGLTTLSLSEDTTTTVANPERGFFEYTESHYHTDGTGFAALDSSSLITARTTSGHALVYRYYYLEKWRTVDTIDSTYLGLLAADLATARTAGVKMVIRFAYADSGSGSPPYNSDTTVTRTRGHVAQLTPVLNAAADVIYAVEAGFIGTWGEWYYSDNWTSTPSTPWILDSGNWTDRTNLLSDLLNQLDSRIFVLVRYPGVKRHIFGATPTDGRAARVGFHDDSFLASSDDWGTTTTFTDLNESDTWAYVAAEVAKGVPMGGESANQNSPRSDWTNANTQLGTYQWCFMNPLYQPDVLSSWGSNIDIAKRQLGYRLYATALRSQTTVARGASLRVELDVTSAGYSFPLNQRRWTIVLDDQAGNRANAPVTTVDIRKLTPGTWTVWANVPVPASLPAGTYRLGLWLPDRDPGLTSRPEYSLRLTNAGTWNSVDGYNDFRLITLT